MDEQEIQRVNVTRRGSKIGHANELMPFDSRQLREIDRVMSKVSMMELHETVAASWASNRGDSTGIVVDTAIQEPGVFVTRTTRCTTRITTY